DRRMCKIHPEVLAGARIQRDQLGRTPRSPSGRRIGRDHSKGTSTDEFADYLRKSGAGEPDLRSELRAAHGTVIAEPSEDLLLVPPSYELRAVLGGRHASRLGTPLYSDKYPTESTLVRPGLPADFPHQHAECWHLQALSSARPVLPRLMDASM